MKIAFYIPKLGAGGAERVFINLCNSYIDENKIWLIVDSKSNFFYSDLDDRVNIIEIGNGNIFNKIIRFKKAIKRINPNSVISTLYLPNIINAIVGKILYRKYKVILRQAAPLIYKNKKSIKSKVSDYILKLSFSYADTVIANSEGTKTSLVENGIIKNRQTNIKVIYNPIISEKIYQKAEESFVDNEILKNPYILSVGRLEASKNIEHLIKSFGLVVNDIDHNLIIIGEGSHKDKLKKLVKQLNIEDRVIFKGLVENPFKYYKNAKLFVLTSIKEGFGNVLVEAMAFGLPIISTNCIGAPNEILGNGRYGHIIEVNNVEQLSSAIIRSISEDRFDKSDQIKKRAEDFSIDLIADKYFNSIV